MPLSHSAGARPVRLRRGGGGDLQCGAQGALLRAGSAPQRRLLCEGLSGGAHRDVPGRSRVGLRLPGRGAPEHPVRQHQAGGSQDPGRTDSRKRTRAFTELQSHYLFEDRFGRPGKGNDQGKVEGMVGYVRRNFLVPVPSFQSFDALNAHLEQRCLETDGLQCCGGHDPRPSASAWSGTWRPCSPCPPCPMTPATSSPVG